MTIAPKLISTISIKTHLASLQKLTTESQNSYRNSKELKVVKMILKKYNTHG